MICPFCADEGKKSIVTALGAPSRTLVYFAPQWDEDGNLIRSNPNTVTASYSCSRGHRWQQKTRGGFISSIVQY